VTWRKVSDYCIRSDCGGYTVCKIGDRFEWWHGKEQGDLLETAEEAKQACVAHKQRAATAA
jgi:hypothetical protein